MNFFTINSKIMNVFYFIIIAPLLWGYATNRIPSQYNQIVIILALLLALYNLYLLFLPANVEGMNLIEEQNISNGNQIYDVSASEAYGFSIPKLTINQNDTVVWTNAGKIQHTVTSCDGLFDSGYLNPGEFFSYKFTQKGTYYYYCIPHVQKMRGVVFVQ